MCRVFFLVNSANSVGAALAAMNASHPIAAKAAPTDTRSLIRGSLAMKQSLR